jgi:hypothetical protein
MLNILEPIIFPTDIPALPDRDEDILTDASGALVPKATKVIPTTMAGISMALAINEAEFTKVWKQATKTTIICLDVEGTKYQAFIKSDNQTR